MRAAAEVCFASQRTLSFEIRKLEEELGAALFERTNKRVKFTPVGEYILILRHAERLLQTARAKRIPRPIR
jgi:LysR family transcriptional regulator, hydrogen peroxide-inducible genes activator